MRVKKCITASSGERCPYDSTSALSPPNGSENASVVPYPTSLVAQMRQGGHYADLYNTYFRHQSLDYVENARTMFAEDETLHPEVIDYLRQSANQKGPYHSLDDVKRELGLDE